MLDFGKLCFLDVQKTGSTFACAFLKECATLPMRGYLKHGLIRNPSPLNGWGLGQNGFFDPQTLYFNSVRHPYDYYVSLYNYGCDGRGGLYQRLKKAEKDDLYGGSADHFYRWLDFMLSPQAYPFIQERFEQSRKSSIGFFTFRFLRLSLASPIRKISKAQSQKDINRLYETDNICEFTIAQEQLRRELESLALKRFPNCFLKEKVDLFLSNPRINSSKSKRVVRSDIEDYPGLDRFLEKESLVFNQFYPI